MNKTLALLAATLAATAIAQDKGAKAPDAKAPAAAAPAAPAAKAAEPKGKAAAEVIRATATVEAIDQKTREVTLKGEKGNMITFTAGPEVKNLAQVSKGDKVTFEYAQALAMALKKAPAGTPPSRVDSEVAKSAPLGQMPAGVVAREIRVVAAVDAVDAKTGMVTLRGPKQSVELNAKDPAILKDVKVGDMVEAVYVEAVGIKVEKAAAAPAAPAPAPAKK